MPSVTYSVSKPSAPESVQILTSGNYTVPVGKIAKVSANCSGGATVSLNGSVVLTGAAWSTMVSNSSSQTITATKNFPTGLGGTYPLTGRAINQTAGSTMLASGPSPFGGGTVFGSFDPSQAESRSVADTFTNSTASSSLNAEYTVPAGTIISTSSGRCVIEIYSA